MHRKRVDWHQVLIDRSMDFQQFCKDANDLSPIIGGFKGRVATHFGLKILPKKVILEHVRAANPLAFRTESWSKVATRGCTPLFKRILDPRKLS